MNWQQYIDKAVGDKPTFTNAEVRTILANGLKFDSTNWCQHRR